ncbi:flavin reductase family protein [Cesiribacter sp. SM1]|uniref:flavin reductase family protein n=1 Tax=Cesiribacter sp. SM1 TaxID=2861196 RepID=UPI001CD1BFE3|nr:flavin reductase family protein [Cesiribacter sp. SM1]
MKRDMERTVGKHDPLAIALKKITYGFYILTTRQDGEKLSQRAEDYYAAGLVSWVTQCSFDPPMISVAVQKQSDLNETISKSRVFALNILGKADLPMISPFSKKTAVEPGRLNGFAFEEGEKTGVPVFKSVPAYLECRVKEIIHSEADHVIFMAEVVNVEVLNPDAEPLIEWETEYHYGG